MVSSLVELQDEYGDQGLVIIGIDAGEDAETVRAFAEKHNLNYLNLLGDLKVMRDYNLQAHPLSVVLTPQGTIYSQQLGWVGKEVLERDIQVVLSLL